MMVSGNDTCTESRLDIRMVNNEKSRANSKQLRVAALPILGE